MSLVGIAVTFPSGGQSQSSIPDVGLGDIAYVRLQNAATSTICVGTTKENESQLNTLIAAQDLIGIQQMDHFPMFPLADRLEDSAQFALYLLRGEYLAAVLRCPYKVVFQVVKAV